MLDYSEDVKKSGFKRKVCISLIVFTFLTAPFSAVALESGLGIEERLGASVPLDSFFYDESGNRVDLRSLVKRPTIVALAYYRCSNLCPNTLSNFASALERLKAEAGKEYSVITISFDENDRPADALEKKRNYVKAAGRPFPEDAWRFLTGDAENISRFTEAVGFRFQRQGDGFMHPSALIVLSSEGRIIRYLYGNTFLPFDLKMALVEAGAGRVGPTIPKALLFCYRYDPAGRRYALNFLRLGGAGILASALAFFIYLSRGNKKAKDASKGGPNG